MIRDTVETVTEFPLLPKTREPPIIPSPPPTTHFYSSILLRVLTKKGGGEIRLFPPSSRRFGADGATNGTGGWRWEGVSWSGSRPSEAEETGLTCEKGVEKA